jgi:hypothetical protein
VLHRQIQENRTVQRDFENAECEFQSASRVFESASRIICNCRGIQFDVLCRNALTQTTRCSANCGGAQSIASRRRVRLSESVY